MKFIAYNSKDMIIVKIRIHDVGLDLRLKGMVVSNAPNQPISKKTMVEIIALAKLEMP